MTIQQAYDIWSKQYDTNLNKTRDLEGHVIRQILSAKTFENGLEIGCGTGKNTLWLSSVCKQLTALDFSEKMMEQAKSKITKNGGDNVQFVQADITKNWHFVAQANAYDLITFSLVLEHIEDVAFIFQEVKKAVAKGGWVYIGEFHPFKQYSGSKARFDTPNGTEILTCFDHHISDFTQLAHKYGFTIHSLNEHFDDNNRQNLPRIFTLLLESQ